MAIGGLYKENASIGGAEVGCEGEVGSACSMAAGALAEVMAAIKAINAARMALRGDGTHFVSLDKVIPTMRDTGADMKSRYKETARGGLALNMLEAPAELSVNIPEC